MYAVEKLSSYISKGVYSVSGPFHPFGGAVDIIVVQHEDGSFKSSPWYVRFGKFQGVLKAKEKVVKIRVNDVEAGFSMYLNSKGEAFFHRDAEDVEAHFIPPLPTSGDRTVTMTKNVLKKARSLEAESTWKAPVTQLEVGNDRIIQTNSRQSKRFGRMFGGKLTMRDSTSGNSGKSMKEVAINGGMKRVNSLERAEIAADLMEVKWSTNLTFSDWERGEKSKELPSECFEMNLSSVNPEQELQGNICANLMVAEEHFKEISSHDNLAVQSEVVYESAIKRTEADSAFSSVNTAQPVDGIHGKRYDENRENDLKSFSQSIGRSFSASDVPYNDLVLASFDSICEGPFALGVYANQEPDDACRHGRVDINREACGLEETAESHVSTSESLGKIHFPLIGDEIFGTNGSGCELQNNDTVVETNAQILKSEFDIEEYETKVLDDEHSQEDTSDALMSYSSPIIIPACKKKSDGNELNARSLPDLLSPINHFEEPYRHHHLSSSLDANLHIYEMNMLEEEDTSSLKQGIELESNQDPGKLAIDATYTNIVVESSREKLTTSNTTIELSPSKHLLAKGMGAEADRQAFDFEKENIIEPQGIPVEGEGKKAKIGHSRANSSPEGSWKLWPFGLRKARTLDTVQTPMENAIKKDEAGNSNRESSVPRTNIRRKVKWLTPATEELASLKLKEGRNMVTFTFSTPMLGVQQVDARIYLWKWNTRIVISDVDGTITKSDVLGQFMPLVGMDWNQTGVTHLYSAIKENGYQFLFLSARAITQAHITRQFLVNLKQNGKVLPDGPVVISPDGLFPSLYREVIRRAPHEFKISCLEAIKTIFPPDCNPFYAGFGNRDTDEISYLKVGIPLGKIFIINPRGEVAINRQLDTKSYNKLHELVNAIFPPRISDEQVKRLD